MAGILTGIYETDFVDNILVGRGLSLYLPIVAGEPLDETQMRCAAGQRLRNHALSCLHLGESGPRSPCLSNQIHPLLQEVTTRVEHRSSDESGRTANSPLFHVQPELERRTRPVDQPPV